MASPKQASPFYREYDLGLARQQGAGSEPAPHQNEALKKMKAWYQADATKARGGILVLPTGGGKTFTAIHFLCSGPLSQGYKVLWLAHTHHLLEQAFFGFGPTESSPKRQLVALIGEPKKQLNARVSSGTIGHFPANEIKATDDVVISTLQTISNAITNRLKSVEDFLAAAKGKLCVVFDEAHHAPAPSYRKLLSDIRERWPSMCLLGLTATPTYGQEKKRGWLLDLFPQGIIYQVEPTRLMAARILAKPVLEEAKTTFEPSFDERDYQKWLGTNRDLPEDIITTLATTKERNDCIVGHYLSNRERYGKTIVFADRWFQCEYLRQGFNKGGVRADVVYSQVDADPGSAEARNKRSATENAKVLQDFREGKLDVLINVRMLTEGTDVPDVQTVFLTRQTTSKILLTQMMGRALRGKAFGGTENAYIVFFIDNWKQRISFAAYDQLAAGLADPSVAEYGKRPPLQLISIDLVRRLAQQMESGINVNPAPYQTFLPVGWYRVEYYALVQGSEDRAAMGQLVMVFEDEKPGFEKLVALLEKTDLQLFKDESVQLDMVSAEMTRWHDQFFADLEPRVSGGRLEDMFAIARHMADNDNQPPKFFPFEARGQHDLDAVAQHFLAQDLGPGKTDDALRGEYAKQDRLWSIIYYNYEFFKSHYDACINRLLHARLHRGDPKSHRPVIHRNTEAIRDREPSDDLKKQVKSRDGRCLCCNNSKKLVVDHIYPSYHGGNNQLDNLQTLCVFCNDAKGIDTISFRINKTPLSAALSSFPMIFLPAGEEAKFPEQWEMFLRHSLNFFYRCAAVESVKIGKRGVGFHHWQVRLFSGNDNKWVQPHLKELVARIRQAREIAGYEPAPDEIEVTI